MSIKIHARRTQLICTVSVIRCVGVSGIGGIGISGGVFAVGVRRAHVIHVIGIVAERRGIKRAFRVWFYGQQQP
ncbi:MAG TPA: hypothetical protein VLB46_19135 [Pyrinomonadaceae bacterium]|nr:hypothetical protein [Pyrinomonadaceae bacterium]